jgi:hypothetical protein
VITQPDRGGGEGAQEEAGIRNRDPYRVLEHGGRDGVHTEPCAVDAGLAQGPGEDYH